MIELWYINTVNTIQYDMEELLESLPFEVTKEVRRFRNQKDKRLKLFNRSNVKKHHEFLNDKLP